MDMTGYGLRVTGIDQSYIIPVDEKGKSVGGELFPAPGVTFPEDVHTNSKGMRILIRRDEEGVATSIRVWSKDNIELNAMSHELAWLKESIDKNNETLAKKFKSWVGKERNAVV